MRDNKIHIKKKTIIWSKIINMLGHLLCGSQRSMCFKILIHLRPQLLCEVASIFILIFKGENKAQWVSMSGKEPQFFLHLESCA